jgi:hypothetical protein
MGVQVHTFIYFTVFKRKNITMDEKIIEDPDGIFILYEIIRPVIVDIKAKNIE